MGAYLDSLVAARRERLARMNADRPADPEPSDATALVSESEFANAPSALAEALAASHDVTNILACLKALERRLAALIDALPELEHDDAGFRPDVDDSSRPRLSDVKRVICREHGLTVLDLEGQSRFPAIVRARQVAMYLARQLGAKSFTDIGRFFGDRDHTTALHAYNKIKRLRSEDADLDRNLLELEGRILAASAAAPRPERDSTPRAKRLTTMIDQGEQA